MCVCIYIYIYIYIHTYHIGREGDADGAAPPAKVAVDEVIL